MVIIKRDLPGRALELFRGGLNCAESVMRVFNEELSLGLDEPALKMAVGFGGGVGRAGCLCGALAGAVMVAGAAQDRIKGEDDPKEKAIKFVQKLHGEFARRFKTTCCRKLTKGFQQKQPERRLHCEQFVSGATEILAELLELQTTS
jgi:C_GCAxxG_C_C family probable redox protein